MKRIWLALVSCLVLTGCGSNVSGSSYTSSNASIYKYYVDNVEHKIIPGVNSEKEVVTSVEETKVEETSIELEPKHEEEKEVIQICYVTDDIKENNITDNMEYIDDGIEITCNGHKVYLQYEKETIIPFDMELLIKNIMYDFDCDILIDVRDIYKTEEGASYNEIDEMKEVEGYEEEFKDSIQSCIEVTSEAGLADYYFSEDTMIFIGTNNKELN